MKLKVQIDELKKKNQESTTVKANLEGQIKLKDE